MERILGRNFGKIRKFLGMQRKNPRCSALSGVNHDFKGLPVIFIGVLAAHAQKAKIIYLRTLGAAIRVLAARRGEMTPHEHANIV